ncbi:MAG: DUF4382 domain-containing protein [Bacteroidota bacterium]
MNSLKIRHFLSFLLLWSIVFFTGCEESGISGEVQMKITDAPSDDASIEGVFITVAEVKIDGESYEGFQGKQTIDIMAYQNGNTKVLGLTELEAKSYNRITLVLDTETDADGNAPGCYVMTIDGEKKNLAASAQSSLELSTQAAFDVVGEARSSVVLDFDLRKAIRYEENSDDAFEFVAQSDLNASIRGVDESLSGSIEGQFDVSTFNNPDKVVVYAYQKGSFNKETETQANGDIQFKNAITSTAAVKSGASYTYDLSFLAEGEYEICLVAFEENNNDGKLSFSGFLQGSLFASGSVTTEVSVNAGVAASLDFLITGIIN